MSGLEQAYRRLMRAFPRGYRARREKEMVAVLLAGARTDQQRPAPGEATDLLRAGLHVRAQLLLSFRPLTRLVVATLLLLVAGALIAQVLAMRGELGRPAARGASAGPSIPARFPAWDPIPSAVAGHPLGAAIAAYSTGDEDGFTFTMLVGADRAIARRAPAGQLSPDGRALAVVAGGAQWQVLRQPSLPLLILDLTTGRSRTVPDAAPRVETRVTWSADGSRLAWAEDGRLKILDRATGSLTTQGAADSASYALHDERLAVTRSGRLIVLASDGRVLGTHNTSGYGLARAGWSPDGRRLLLGRIDGQAAHDVAAAVLDVSAGTQSPVDISDEVLAWADGNALLVRGDTFGAPLERLDLTSHVRTTVATFPAHDDVLDLQLATALVPGAQVVARPAAQRGPISSANLVLWGVLTLIVVAWALQTPVPAPVHRPLAAERVAEAAAHVLKTAALLAVVELVLWAGPFRVRSDVRLLQAAGLCFVTACWAVTRALQWARHGDAVAPP